METYTLRFDKNHWTNDTAKAWIKDKSKFDDILDQYENDSKIFIMASCKIGIVINREEFSTIEVELGYLII